jgi:hypothetical protein
VPQGPMMMAVKLIAQSRVQTPESGISTFARNTRMLQASTNLWRCLLYKPDGGVYCHSEMCSAVEATGNTVAALAGDKGNADLNNKR